jgi:hypothetical protein
MYQKARIKMPQSSITPRGMGPRDLEVEAGAAVEGYLAQIVHVSIKRILFRGLLRVCTQQCQESKCQKLDDCFTVAVP